MGIDWLGFSYAALVIAGGVVGFAKAGNLHFLAAELVFSLFAGLGAFITSGNPRRAWLSVVTAGTVAVVMGVRFGCSSNFMPAGLITLASCVVVIKSIIGMVNTSPILEDR